MKLKIIFWLLLITAVVMTCTGCTTPAKCYECEECEVIDPLLATKCLTCGIYFPPGDYGEHIKTCCP